MHERLFHILGLPNIETEDAANVAQALTWYAEGMDFADALHLAGSAELAGLATFDRKFTAIAEKLDAVPSVRLVLRNYRFPITAVAALRRRTSWQVSGLHRSTGWLCG